MIYFNGLWKIFADTHVHDVQQLGLFGDQPLDIFIEESETLQSHTNRMVAYRRNSLWRQGLKSPWFFYDITRFVEYFVPQKAKWRKQGFTPTSSLVEFEQQQEFGR